MLASHSEYGGVAGLRTGTSSYTNKTKGRMHHECTMEDVDRHGGLRRVGSAVGRMREFIGRGVGGQYHPRIWVRAAESVDSYGYERGVRRRPRNPAVLRADRLRRQGEPQERGRRLHRGERRQHRIHDQAEEGVEVHRRHRGEGRELHPCVELWRERQERTAGCQLLRPDPGLRGSAEGRAEG